MTSSKPTTATKDKPTLLTIPQEIRDMIIDDVLSTENPFNETHEHHCPPPELPSNAATGLMMTNKELFQQVVAASSRLDVRLTMKFENDDNDPHWAQVPCQLRFVSKPGEKKRVIEHVDMVFMADEWLQYLVYRDPTTAIESAETILTYHINNLIVSGISICKRGCEHEGKDVWQTCYKRCCIRELRVRILDMPKIPPDPDVGMKDDARRDFVRQCGPRSQGEGLAVQKVSFWHGKTMVRQYEDAAFWKNKRLGL